MSRSKTAARPTPNSEMLFARLGPIIWRRPDELVASRHNPRRHPERQLVALAASIREFGFNVPVLVDADSVVIAGEARVAAARRVCLAEIPTILSVSRRAVSGKGLVQR